MTEKGSGALQHQLAAAVEVYEAGLVEILVGGLDRVGLGFDVAGPGLVEFGDGGLAVLVLGLGELEGVACGIGGGLG